MRSDEAQPYEVAGVDRARTGPRHAAPRKSLLTKLQIPASKAIALAAMPTAVFVGMGLTPKLAQADEVPGNPFAPGPCVTRSDEPQEQKSPSASESAKPSAKPSDKPSDKPSAEPSTEPSAKPSGSAEADEPSTSPSDQADAPADEEKEPSAEPSPSESSNPLDPLGVGDKIRDIFDGPDEEPSPSESSTTAEPKPSSSTAAPEPGETAEKAAEDVKDTTEDVKETTEDVKGTTEDAIKDAADKVGAKVEDVKKSAKGVSKDVKESAEDAGKGTADGKERFPCPTADPKALAAADLEQGVPLLPDEPWELQSSKLTLRGLDYKGIVEVKTYSGKVKKVLKFTAKETDIKDLHQLVVGPKGTTAHVQAEEDSTSTIRDGTVTMYTEELKGNLFGLIPVTFSPETPPPLNVPVAVFTDVKVKQAGQFGGTLTVPGLHSFSTGG
ncbi:hypothetical protein ABZW18_04015 [Streptomyces sp. NPDC004647]|uniref:hypothetical protein n=1 Tax=Streptomyces sp. NPDC004647 TaxID=3154671 RepID=UPI0033A5C4A4